MGLITLTDIANGQDVDAVPVQNNFVTVETVINGNLQNANVAADAAIVGSKLLAARVATSVAGLGTAGDGALGRLRCGVTPFEFLTVIYDATYGKWVSVDRELLVQIDSGTGQFTPTAAYALLPGFATYENRPQPGFGDIYAAGMRPQFRIMADAHRASGTGTGRISFTVYELDQETGGDATAVTLLAGADGHSVAFTAAAQTMFDSDWVQPTLAPAPTADHMGIVQPHVKTSDGATDVVIASVAIWMRWVSA